MFLFKLRGSQKATQFCFRFSKRFLISPIKLLFFFHSCQIVIHLCFARKVLFQFFNSRLPQSFDQNTKQDKTLCLRVSSKNKENISLQSHLSLSLSFYSKNVFGACSNQAQQKLNSRTAIFDVERNALQCFFNDTMGETESHIDMSYTKRLSPAVYSFLSQTDQTKHFVFTRAACIYLCFSLLLVSSPKQSVFLFLKGLPAKKPNLVIVILFPLRKKFISGLNLAKSMIRKR